MGHKYKPDITKILHHLIYRKPKRGFSRFNIRIRKKNFLADQSTFGRCSGDWKIGMILVTKWFKKWIFQKLSITTKMPLNWYSSMKKIFRKIRIIFEIENWLWKSKIRIFQSPPAKHTLICQKISFMEKCYFSLN